jgi:hypothetical protein
LLNTLRLTNFWTLASNAARIASSEGKISSPAGTIRERRALSVVLPVMVNE